MQLPKNVIDKINRTKLYFKIDLLNISLHLKFWL